MEKEVGFPPYKKNDKVQVISGKFKGQQGRILKLIKDKGLVVVEKINLVKRHTKPNQKNPQGGIIEKEAPMHVCKVLPISSKQNKPVRISVWLRETPREARKETSTEGAEGKAKKTKAKSKGGSK